MYTRILLSFFALILFCKTYAYDIAVDNDDGVTIYYNYCNGGTELEVTSGGSQYSGAVVIPDKVTYQDKTLAVTGIGEVAFIRSTRLTSVTIPSGVTTIGYGAFTGCKNLTSIAIPSSVKTIGNSAFHDCTGLTSVTIGNGVTSVCEWAFNQCNGLTSIIIPESVTSIGEKAFCCENLTSITSKIENPFAINRAFHANNYKKATLFVPAGKVSSYKATAGWKDFVSIKEISEGGDSGTKTVMVVKENNDKETSFLLSDNPIITHNKGTVRIATSKTTVEFQMANVKFFTFRESTSSAESITHCNTNDCVAEVFTHNGMKVMTIRGNQISLKTLPKGIYIIKTSSNTYKITNK